jgi:hypothetical protein
MQSKDAEIERLKQELAGSRRLFNGLLTLLGEELKNKALEQLRKHDMPTTEENVKPLTMSKMLYNLSILDEQKAKEEYDKLLEETNGFNGKPAKEKVKIT